jgi:uncharacterized protein (TIGR02466 family)
MTEAMIEKSLFWQTPMYFADYPLHDKTQQSLLAFISDCVEQQSEPIDSAVAVAAKQNLHESRLDFLQQKNRELEQLSGFFRDLVEMAAFDCNGDFLPEDVALNIDITESWYHVTENGGYHDVHSHPNCSWCGIYYLDAGDSTNGNGVNRFYEPRYHADHYLDAGNLYLQQEGFWDVVPQSGQVVIFPSYLKHSALPYFSNNKRVVIAFNCQVAFADGDL